MIRRFDGMAAIRGAGSLPAARTLAFAAQPRDLRLKLLDPAIPIGKRGGDVGGFETLRDVLRTIGVPGGDPEKDHLFSYRLVTLRSQGFRQRRIVGDDARLPQIFMRCRHVSSIRNR